MPAVMSLLSSRPFRMAMLVGAGLAVGGIAYGIYRHRRARAFIQDITDSDQQSDVKWKLKNQLKTLLTQGNVHCKDMDYVEEIIDSLIVGGGDQLQVIADFDRTMTPMKHNGKEVPSCHCVMESCPELDDECKTKLAQLKDYYLAIEVDPSMSKEEKLPFMEEWWEKAHAITMNGNLTKSGIHNAVGESNLYLRKGYTPILELLQSQAIPLLVFSAGVGDIIEQCFIQRYKLYNNIHIIANWMSFSHEGVLVGWKGENIHIYNKNSHALQNAEYFDTIKHRQNVILLGDSLGDLDIAEGLNAPENLLTIGYLNHHIEASLPEYKKRYDIVLVEEDSVELLGALLDNITREV